MKKRVLTILPLFAFALALTSCPQGEEGSTSTGPGSDSATPPAGVTDITTVDLPEAPEGKVTVAFVYSSESLELPEYVSIWLTGGFTESEKEDGTWNGDWPVNYGATEMQLMEGTSDVYYAHITVLDEDEYGGTNGVDSYQLVAGYNRNAGLGESSSGLLWVDNYKSEECQAYSYGTNPKWQNNGDGTIYLISDNNPGAIHTFSTLPPQPVEMENFHLVVSWPEALPSWAAAYGVGTFNNWGNDDDFDISNWKFEALDDYDFAEEGRHYYSLNIGTVIANAPIEYQVVLLAPDASGKPGDAMWQYQFGNAITDEEGNTTYNNNISTTPVAGQGLDGAYDAAHDFVRYPSKVWTDPSLERDVEFRFVNSETDTTVPVDTVPGITGNFTTWAYTAMTLVEDYWTVTITIGGGEQNLEFGVTKGSDWTGAIKDAAGGNLKITVPGAHDLVTITAAYSTFGVGDEPSDFHPGTVTSSTK